MIRLQAVRFTLAWSALMATMACLAAADLDCGAPQKQTARPAAARQTQLALQVFVAVVGDDEKKALAALAHIEQNWRESSAAMLIDMIHFVPSRKVLGALIALIEKKSGRPFDGDINAWYEWLWSAERVVHPDYAGGRPTGWQGHRARAAVRRHDHLGGTAHARHPGTRMLSLQTGHQRDYRASGANRVYESRETTFAGWDNVASARDNLGNAWRVDESQLTATNGQTLKRLPAHRAFWFGWHAAFPETRLIKQ